MIAGERAPGSVRPPQARGKPDDQQLCALISKGRDRGIKPLRVRCPLNLAECGKARAQRTIAQRRRQRGPGRSSLGDGFSSRPVDLLSRMMIARDARRKILKFDEIVRLPAQIVRDHRRRRADRGNY